ncbi:MAG: lycopene cyclase domain-containing protein [Chloroflexota bacterium]
MTYFGFLALFLLPPLFLLLVVSWQDHRIGREVPPNFRTWSPRVVILAHIVVAVLYTTPWDNYLVATRVWWYDPDLVTGILIGWVPIEEYTFFVLQTLLSGLWIVYLMRHTQLWHNPFYENVSQNRKQRGRWMVFALLFLIWIVSIGLLTFGQKSSAYLALELGWALPPILFQIWFGGDILWRYRRLVTVGIAVPTIYLCLGDAIAIGAGTWTISPTQSTGLMVGNLPIEEILFFLITNTLVVFGMVLVMAKESRNRAPRQLIDWLDRLLQPTPPMIQSQRTAN